VARFDSVLSNRDRHAGATAIVSVLVVVVVVVVVVVARREPAHPADSFPRGIFTRGK